MKGQGKTTTDSLISATYGDLTPDRAQALLENSAYSFAKVSSRPIHDSANLFLLCQNNIEDVAFSHPVLHTLALRLVRDNHDTLDPKYHPMTEVTLAIAATFVGHSIFVPI